jgi:biotin transport system substrate-specific component
MNQPYRQLQMTVYSAMFAALITAGAFLAIPIGPVPIVLQNFFVLLAGLLLGGRWGLFCLGVYLLAGACGLPVFAGASGGLGRLFGPTGGYLIGYLPAVFTVGVISRRLGHRWAGDLLALTCGAALVYACGVPWLKLVTGMGWGKAMALGMLPFLPGDALKIAAAIPVARTLRPLMQGRGAGFQAVG